jgi:hypothetical protein
MAEVGKMVEKIVDIRWENQTACTPQKGIIRQEKTPAQLELPRVLAVTLVEVRACSFYPITRLI